jgi:endoglucanase
VLDCGINLGGIFDARQGTDALPWVGAEKLAAAGFRTVRIPVCWTDHLKANGVVDPAFFRRVDKVIDELLDRKLEVILDVHHFDAVHFDPVGQRSVLHALWTQIATRYANRPSSLIYELLNEPRPPMAAGAWNDLALSTLDRVRKVDAERLVLIGPAAANTLDGLNDLRLPGDNQVAMTFHYYSPFGFTHQGACWELGSDAWLGTNWGSQSDREAVTDDLTKAREWADCNGRTVFMGEFGTHQSADRQARIRWTGWVRSEAERLEIGWCYWALGTEFGVYQFELNDWDASLLAALLPIG